MAHAGANIAGSETSDGGPVKYEALTSSPEETIAFGRKLARELRGAGLVVLEGELGSGKTTLTKGIVAGLGAAREEEVTSPSFTLLHEYGGAEKVYHADLYRIEGKRELGTLGLDDLPGQNSTLIVEWGEKLEGQAGEPRVTIHIEIIGENERRIIVEKP